MGLNKVWIVPLATFLFTISAFIISYVVAVKNNHATLFLSYISDAGSFAPESCIFGQLLNMAALFLATTIYLRHRQIVEFYWHRLKQEHNVLYIHYAGAFLAFGCGLIYTWAQTILTYQMCPKLAEPLVYHCRLALCIFASVLFVTTIVCGPILGTPPTETGYAENSNVSCAQPYIWNMSEDNYDYHVIGTGSEWLLAICFQLYILSFAIELRHAYCHAPKLKLASFCHVEKRSAVAPAADDQTPVVQLFGLKHTNINHTNNRTDKKVFKSGKVANSPGMVEVDSHYSPAIIPGVNPAFFSGLEGLPENTVNLVRLEHKK